MTNAERQKAFHRRRAERLDRMKKALETIRDELANAEGSKGKKLRTLANEALVTNGISK